MILGSITYQGSPIIKPMAQYEENALEYDTPYLFKKNYDNSNNVNFMYVKPWNLTIDLGAVHKCCHK